MSINISAADVNKLRQITGAGMMDCKKALEETAGDFEAAIEYLRKKGQKVAAKRADREAKEGAAIALASADGKRGIALVVTSETDFVAKNADFVAFANQVAQLALEKYPATKEELLATSFDGSISLEERLAAEVGKIGEKIEVSKYQRLEGELVVPYIHAGNKIGVLVALNKQGNDAFITAGKDIAMQTAAMSPVALDESLVTPETIEKELEIYRDQARQEGKPENMLDKIAQGKLQRFFKDSTLLNQQFVKNNELTVRQYLKTIDKDLAATGFCRVAIGS